MKEAPFGCFHRRGSLEAERMFSFSCFVGVLRGIASFLLPVGVWLELELGPLLLRIKSTLPNSPFRDLIEPRAFCRDSIPPRVVCLESGNASPFVFSGLALGLIILLW